MLKQQSGSRSISDTNNMLHGSAFMRNKFLDRNLTKSNWSRNIDPQFINRYYRLNLKGK